MRERHFDLIARRAAHAISRRTSLASLSGAAVAALAGPATSKARIKTENKNKKSRKNCGKKIRKTCRRQGAQFRQFVFDTCFNDLECENTALPCAEPFGRCDTVEGVRCVIAVVTGG